MPNWLPSVLAAVALAGITALWRESTVVAAKSADTARELVTLRREVDGIDSRQRTAAERFAKLEERVECRSAP